MTVKHVPTYICDYCGEETSASRIETHRAVGNEGCSTILLHNPRSKPPISVLVDDADFCDLKCFYDWIENNLNAV